MKKWRWAFMALIVLLSVSQTGAWVRDSPVASRVANAVMLERAATQTYVQEVAGGCDVMAPADETEGGGVSWRHVQCWNVWLESDDGKTRTRLVRVWGMRAKEWATAYQERFERDAFLVFGNTPANPRAYVP